MKTIGTLLLLTAWCGSATHAQEEPMRREGSLWFQPIKADVGGQVYEGERGHLIVRENRKNANSNLIELVFVRLKSTSDKPGYPTVYLDGGPGSSATNLAGVPDYMRAFQKLREVGDVILLDQRGVGQSRPNLTYRTSESLPTDFFADRAADEFRSPLKTEVPTLFVSGVLDNNTQPFQADEVRKNFKNSTHIVIDNAGHESMLVDPQVQQTMVQFLRGEDVSKVKIALPPLKFEPLP